MIVYGEGLSDEAAILDLEDGTEAVGVCLVRTEEPEVRGGRVECERIAQHLAQLAGGLLAHCGRRRHTYRVVAEVGQVEILKHPAAVGVRVRAHAPLPLRGKRGELFDEPAILVEEFFGAVGAQPLLQKGELLGIGPDVRERHLVGAEGTGNRQAAYHARPGPALGGTQHDRWPVGTRRDVKVSFAGPALDGPDLLVAQVECGGEGLVHAGRVVPLDEVYRIAVPFEQLADLLVWSAAKHGGARDLVAVEVQYRQDRSVASRVEVSDGFPRALKRSGLRFAVTDDGSDEEIRVVEGCAEGVGEYVAEFTAFVDRAGGWHTHVAGHPAGSRESPEEPLHPRGV